MYPTPSNNPLEAAGQLIRERNPGDTTHPVEAIRASSLPRLQGAIPLPHNRDKEKGELTPSDADTPDSIARALLDVLQERWSGNKLPFRDDPGGAHPPHPSPALVDDWKGTI